MADGNPVSLMWANRNCSAPIRGKAAGPKRRTFVFTNTTLEGNAILTIAAILEPGEA
jgi:hypothetical protein